MKPKTFYFIFLSIVLIWCFMILLTPYLSFSNHGKIPKFFYTFFSNICHQMPERSLFLFERQVPVCARDFAIYFSFLLAALLYPFLKKLEDARLPPIKYLLLALIPIGIDGGTQLIGLRESTNFLRILTGFVLGFVTPFYLIPFFIGSLKEK